MNMVAILIGLGPVDRLGNLSNDCIKIWRKTR